MLVKGYIGPWSATGPVLGEESATGIRYLVDPRVVDGTALDHRRERATRSTCFGLVAGRDFVADGTVEVAEVRAGDPAPDGSGPVELARGMEIGHVFQLGRKYAEALGLKVLDENGKLVTVTMGSYGIGVTRILAIIAELNNDDKGLIWPRSGRARSTCTSSRPDEGRRRLRGSPRQLVGRARGGRRSTCSTTTGRRCRPASSSATPSCSACR